MSINIQTANGLKSLTGEKLTSAKVVSALGYTPANTNDLQKYLTITDASSTYASTSYVDTKWNDAIDIISTNFVSKNKEATANELGLVKISTDKQDIYAAQELDTSVPTVYAILEYFNENATHIANDLLTHIYEYFITKNNVDSSLNLYSTNPVQNKVIANYLQNIESDIVNNYLSKENGEATGLKVTDHIDLGNVDGSYAITLSASDDDTLLVNGKEVAFSSQIPDVSTYLTKNDAASMYASSSNTYSKAEIDDKLENISANAVNNSGTTSVLFYANTHVGDMVVANNSSELTITLNDNVQAGDKIRVYVNGGSSYPQMQAAVIEFELYNPSEKTLAGVGSVMCNTGASMGIISASVSSTLKITNQLKITIYCLTNSVHAAGSSVYVNKVERVRFVSTTTYISGDNVAYGSGSTITNYEYGDVEGTAIDGDDLTYGGDS